MLRPWRRLRWRLPRLRVDGHWQVITEVLQVSLQFQLLRRTTAIAMGAMFSQLWGLLALWATAPQPTPIRGMLNQVALYFSQRLPFLGLQLPAEAPGLAMVAIATIACWWGTTLTLNYGSQTLRRRFPGGQRTATSRLKALLVAPTRSGLWLTAAGIGLFLIASGANSTFLGGLLRWGAALIMFTIGYGVIYRLSPGRWLPGHPLLPGAFLTASVNLLGLGLLNRAVPAANDLAGATTVVSLMLWMVALYGASLMLLIGGQVNVSLGRRSAPIRSQIHALPKNTPPSFESFTIRRPPDRLP